jgi:hypothetical protein
MFPITKPELSFGEISEYWAPELRWSRDMVQALLEGAWWLGKISSDSTTNRLELLKRLFKWMRNCESPAIIFVTPESAPAPETKELPNGHLAVDLRPRVFVPSEDVDTWSEASCIPAFQALAEKPSLQHYPEWSPGFQAMKLTRDEFFRWIAVRDFPYPTFWKRTNDDATSLNLKPASVPMIEGEVRRAYDIADEEGKKPPNINEVAKLVQARLREIGHRASGRQIKGIAERPEFTKRRRPPGKTLSSEKRGPRK